MTGGDMRARAQVITAVQDKGGVGKSAILCSLAAYLAADGARVAIVDTDPQRTCAAWAEQPLTAEAGWSDRLAVAEVLDDGELIPVVERLAESYDAVLVDTAGYKNAMAVYAIQSADLVLVPMAPSLPDLNGAIRVWRQVESAKRTARRQAVVRIVINGAVARASITADVRRGLADVGAPVLRAELGFLTGFRELLTQGGGPTKSAAASFRGLVAAMQMEGLLTFYGPPARPVAGRAV